MTIPDVLRARLPIVTTLLIVTSQPPACGEDHIRTYEGDRPMATAWTNDELDRVGSAEEPVIASVCRDGAPSKPRTIWVARVSDGIYVRSVYGPPPTGSA
ncbi:DUF2255 family protein [Streptomyces asoensis]|uniref:DUF2255 family protein n=1 Tax=Streptomyces asoensis TaxID=249586 RepID=A0A6M4WI72_9ACTN|nr:DUF2255 family protein [Streptomyces asoensis]QJS99858.1 DUF2255 family protein [Streptomyces asoensis]